MVQESELITLSLGLVGMVVLRYLLRRFAFRRVGWFFVGFGVLVAGQLATVVEGFFWSETLNAIEHARARGSYSARGSCAA